MALFHLSVTQTMSQLAAAAVNKLQAMTDSAFSETVFTLTDDE